VVEGCYICSLHKGSCRSSSTLGDNQHRAKVAQLLALG
jgi:hypothetical protein